MKLTVVIIGKNEEQFIGKAIASVLAVKPRIPELEVVFVDSASTDRSVEVAKEFPIRILQLRPDWPLCVAAGRYTGFRNSSGEYVLFLDGDAEAEPDWLVRAVKYMDENPDCGAIAGVLDEEYVTPEDEHVGGTKNVFKQDLSKPVIQCKALGGIAMYRRKALDQVGQVNPHLPTGEDDELCMRIRNAGFKLIRIEGRMAIKYTEKRETLHEVFRRTRTKMYDYGAVVRYCATYGAGTQYCLDAIPYIVSFSILLALGFLLTPIAIWFRMGWVPLVLTLLLFAAVVIKRRGIYNALLSLAVRAVSTYRTVVSFLTTKPKPIDAYPTDVIVIK